MQSTRFISLSIAVASLSGCAAPEAIPEADAEAEAGAEAEPRAIVPVVRPDFEFRFAPGMPSLLDRTAAASSSYSLHQELPVGPVTITGTVSYDSVTKIAIFTPDADLDARYPYTWEVTGGLADYLEDMPIDIVQAPCVDIDATIDGVPVSDGIPSCREQTGTWYRSQPLAAWGADPAQVDVFIEIDYYNHDDPDLPGATPQWGRSSGCGRRSSPAATTCTSTWATCSARPISTRATSTWGAESP